ncbi:MAG: malonyl-[acyl-carrier protein] O-methyltransferase BioC [Candidatus Contendobacter odensis]|uniref:Malonyl-[acyl-carrier protein] O-methyltransferase n=1 Tax=Candidatus Contendibacter odensensis TaxID=1400860 RepID=A0A2G6PE66_9GAMM|nr:MAG: malonyl-[acyl-carrier protein] O-methyltransferase BioC [Candidatus Contendobacter odensis]
MCDEIETWPFEPDRRWLQVALERAAKHHDEAAFLHHEIGDRLLERLDVIRFIPEVIVDVGCATGITTAALMKRYRKAQVIATEHASAMIAMARRRVPWWRTLHGVVAEAGALPLAEASCDLIFSNLTLPWYPDLDSVFAEFRRVLKPGGVLLFSTLGPDTLKELRQSWSEVDSYNHVNAFFDMHDIGDALVRARLAEPVIDVERLTLTYTEIGGLMRDLAMAGARNVTMGRPRGLMGKGRMQAMRNAYDQFRQLDGLLPVTCEVVYGHAWGVLPSQLRLRPGEREPAVFPLSRLLDRGQGGH